MIEKDKGHRYALTSYSFKNDGPTDTAFDLIFVKKIGEGYPGNKPPEFQGTNCQEVLRALIARCKYLYNQIPCVETESSLYYLRRALFAFELRAARIKDAKLPETVFLHDIEMQPHCFSCGHIYIHDFENCRKLQEEPKP